MKHHFENLFIKNFLIKPVFQRKRYERKTRRWKQSSSQGWVSSILMLLEMEHHKIIFKCQIFIFQIMVNAALWQINAVHRLKFQNDFSSTFLVLLSPFSSISPPFWPFHGLASLLFDILKVRNSLTDYLYHSFINNGCTWALGCTLMSHPCKENRTKIRATTVDENWKVYKLDSLLSIRFIILRA